MSDLLSAALPGELGAPSNWALGLVAGALYGFGSWLIARAVFWIPEFWWHPDGAQPGIELGTTRLARLLAVVAPVVASLQLANGVLGLAEGLEEGV